MTKLRLPLPLSTLVLLVACNQVTSALTMGEKPADPTPAVDTKAAAGDPAGPTPAAVAAPSGPATVDELLGLVHEGASTYVVFKSPDSLLGLAETTAGTFEQPVTALLNATQPDKAAELTQNLALFKANVAKARAALAEAGTDLQRGVVITSTRAGDDDPVLIFSAKSPEAAKTLLTAWDMPEADKVACQAAPRAGYVTCSKDQEALAAYKPGEATTVRHRLNTALPALAIDELAVFGYVADGDVHFGMNQPTGGFTVHVSAPPDAHDMVAAMAPGKADLLRFAPPGTGFMWMKLDLDELKKKGMNDVPPMFSATVGAFTGEILFGGSADPAALQARFGFSDTSTLAPLADLAVAFGGPMIHNKPIPEIKGSKVTFKAEDVSLGAEKTKALHFALSGVPQAKALADQLGLALDAWLYPAEGTLAAVIGVDAKSVGNVKAAATTDATIAALPPSLGAALNAGEVGFVAHVPLDGLQSPVLTKLLDDALGKMPGYDPATVRTALGVAAPLSSTTVWVTEHQNSGVIHFAVQTIGNTSDDEGKAAFAAAASADPAKAFADLAAKYPSSPRLAAYQARAGQGGPGALIGSSGPAILFAAGALVGMLRPAAVDADTVVEAPPVPPAPAPDPAKKDAPPKADPPKADPPKADPPKADPPKADPPKADPPKTPSTPGPIKAEPAKTDPQPVPRPNPPPIRLGREASK